jgi:TonB family protein
MIFQYFFLYVNAYSKPPKNQDETINVSAYKQYVTMYNDSIKYSAYLDSIIKSKGYCITDTNNVFRKGEYDVEASFVGGQTALINFLVKNTVYPTFSRALGQEGKVIVKVIVNEDGQICNPIILRKGGYGLPEEAINVIRLFPQWIPAKKNNQNVKSYYLLPFTFKLQ